MERPNTTMSRRSLLRLSALGLAGIAVGCRPGLANVLASATVRLPGTTVSLTMRECLLELVDESRAAVWAFDSPDTGPRVPGPVISVVEGDPVAIEVTNELTRTHAFTIPGVVDSGPIEPGATARVTFSAPAAGTYVYLDPLRAPMHRAMGLAGVLVVVPREGTTPYSTPTVEVQNLFDDLGTTTLFPGRAWEPDRSWVWVFSCIDPASHARAAAEPDLSPEAFTADYEPSYFLLNGRSGYFAAHDPATAIRGRVGQPALIRTANIGMATHSPHIHGNHVYVLAHDRVIEHNLYALDTWRVPPLGVTDVLHPFVRPPDAFPWPPSDPKVWTTDLAGDGMVGMVYPMHCHMELSQLANGGNYPHGLLTHWVLVGDLEPGPVEPPAPVFSDVERSEHRSAIEAVAAAGIALGYDDGTFRPSNPVTRGQMASFVARALGLPLDAAGPTFPDVPHDHAHVGAIRALAGADVVHGRPDGTYRPDDPVTRGQTATILTNALDLPAGPPSGFDDVPRSHPHATAIDAVRAAGITQGRDATTFLPDAPVTREQMATFIARGWHLIATG